MTCKNAKEGIGFMERARVLKDKEPQIEIMRGRQDYLSTKRVIKAREIVNDFFLNPSKRGENSPIFQAIEYAMKYWGKDFEVELNPDQVLYRARVVSDEDCTYQNGISVDENGHTKGFNEDNSLEAPPRKASAGRNNPEGVSYLYLSDDLETACSEIKESLGSVISIAEIRIKRNLKLFDFSKTTASSVPEDGELDWAAIFHEIVRLYYRPIKEEKDYEATQKISKYIKNKGYDGIAYVSYFTASMNYTIFSTDHKNYELKSSRLIVVQESEQHYYDFNNKQYLTSNINRIEFDKKKNNYIIEDIREQLKKNSLN